MSDPYVKFDGLEAAIIGFAWPWQNQREKVAVYSYDKILDILVERDGMTPEEAGEFIDFNIDGMFVGHQTPIIVIEGAPGDEH